MSARPSAARYARVSTQDRDTGPMPQTRKVSKSLGRKQLAETVAQKMGAILWIIASAVVIYFTDFFKVLGESEKVNRFWLNLAFVCLGVDIVIAIYLIWILPCFTPKVLGKELDWNISAPRAVPTAAAFGVIMTIAMNIGLWPVFGFLTPFILGINFLGFLMTMHFIPTCGLC